MFFNTTGLLIDSYFSGTKIKCILDNVPKANQLMDKNQRLFGTIHSFLIWRLTKGTVHATYATNASRTMLFNINNNPCDKELLKKLTIPKKLLPKVKNSADNFGKTDNKIIGG